MSEKDSAREITDDKNKRFLTYGSVEAEGVLNEMVRKKQFSDVVLGSWALVDLSVSGLLQLCFGLNGTDSRADFFHKRFLQFDDKVTFLRDLGIVTQEEYDMISQFQHDRNALLHTKKGKVAWFFKLTEKEKGDIISHAWNAVNASGSALIRLTEMVRTGTFPDFTREHDLTQNETGSKITRR